MCSRAAAKEGAQLSKGDIEKTLKGKIMLRLKLLGTMMAWEGLRGPQGYRSEKAVELKVDSSSNEKERLSIRSPSLGIPQQ